MYICIYIHSDDISRIFLQYSYDLHLHYKSQTGEVRRIQSAGGLVEASAQRVRCIQLHVRRVMRGVTIKVVKAHGG